MGAEVAAIAIQARKRRQRRAILDHFCALHAITPYDTILYTPPPALKRQFDAMLAERIVRQEGHAYYWIDLAAWDAAIERRRRRMVPIVIALCLVVAFALMLGFYRG